MTHDALQSECFQWHWNTYPDDRYLVHANNNNSVNRAKGTMDKAIGVVRGVSDLEYFKNRVLYGFEIKVDEDYQKPHQKLFQKAIEREGGKYYIIRSLEQYQAIVNEIRENAEIELPF